MAKSIDLEHMVAQMKVRSTSHGYIETNSAMVHVLIYILCTATVWFCSFIYVNCEICDSSVLNSIILLFRWYWQQSNPSTTRSVNYPPNNKCVSLFHIGELTICQHILSFMRHKDVSNSVHFTVKITLLSSYQNYQI